MASKVCQGSGSEERIDTIHIWSRTAGNEFNSKLVKLLTLESPPDEQVREVEVVTWKLSPRVADLHVNLKF